MTHRVDLNVKLRSCRSRESFLSRGRGGRCKLLGRASRSCLLGLLVVDSHEQRFSSPGRISVFVPLFLCFEHLTALNKVPFFWFCLCLLASFFHPSDHSTWRPRCRLFAINTKPIEIFTLYNSKERVVRFETSNG